MTREMGQRAFLIVALVLLMLAALAYSKAKAADAMPAFNAIRAYTGLPQVEQAPQLQVEAQRRADQMAAAGKISTKVRVRRGLFRKGTKSKHLPGWSAGNREGVGVKRVVDPQGRGFYACGMNRTGYRYAGAATSVKGGRTFYCLIWGK